MDLSRIDMRRGTHLPLGSVPCVAQHHDTAVEIVNLTRVRSSNVLTPLFPAEGTVIERSTVPLQEPARIFTQRHRDALFIHWHSRASMAIAYRVNRVVEIMMGSTIAGIF